MATFEIFTLRIEGGNDTMQTPSDIAETLRRVAFKLEYGCSYGNIIDLNGNTVGTFRLDWESPDS
jgi:hypothetical protein